MYLCGKITKPMPKQTDPSATEQLKSAYLSFYKAHRTRLPQRKKHRYIPDIELYNLKDDLSNGIHIVYPALAPSTAAVARIWHGW